MTRQRTAACLLLLFATLSGVFALWQFRLAREHAAHFDPVEAEIIANRIRRDWARHTSAESSAFLFRAEILLRYQYQGSTWETWYQFPLSTGQRSRVEALLGQQCPGTRLTLFVNPDQPDQFLLAISGHTHRRLALTLLTLALLFTAPAIYLLAPKRSPRALVYLS